MNRLLFTLFALLTVSTLPAQTREQTIAEEFPDQAGKYAVAVYPLHLFNNGLRLDFEMKIKNTPAWIQIGASGYFGTMPSAYNEYNKWSTIYGEEFNHLLGAGLELNYKRFFNQKETWYYAGGCSYSRYNVDYVDRYWYSYIEDGMEYRTTKFGSLNQKIDKFGISAYLGHQKSKHAFLSDIFVGLGYRYSLKSNRIAKSFDDSMLAWGYKGVVFITGVRIGVKFKQ
ncbi:MAG: hypothetical protein LBQ01_06465 [Prevotellaceae bacterium]|jgi:hypothetical protein|nr:hypothetical protein [Prevotellaceae bacterium]